jgi:Uma2 family endonuclease
MPTPATRTTTTAAELFAQPSDGYRYELISGELRMMSPAGGRHGRIAITLAFMLKQHVDANDLGTVYAAETGFLIGRQPDTVLAPDVAFLSAERVEAIESDVGYIEMAPDLVGEVLSPSDRFSRVEAKAFQWLDAGTKLVLLVDPETETVHCYRSRKQIEVYEKAETIDCNDAVNHWTLPISKLFT